MTAILALMLCESLAKLTLPNTTITNAQIVAANLPAFRRVQATITPSADSHIEVEVWLPESRWNGKYLGVGNGGFGGSFNYYRLGEALNSGYATEKQIDFD